MIACNHQPLGHAATLWLRSPSSCAQIVAWIPIVIHIVVFSSSFKTSKGLLARLYCVNPRRSDTDLIFLLTTALGTSKILASKVQPEKEATRLHLPDKRRLGRRACHCPTDSTSEGQNTVTAPHGSFSIVQSCFVQCLTSRNSSCNSSCGVSCSGGIFRIYIIYKLLDLHQRKHQS